MATPPGEAEPPHVGEQDFPTNIPGAESAAVGGGTVIPGAANLSGEGHLEAGRLFVPTVQLAGSGSLTV